MLSKIKDSLRKKIGTKGEEIAVKFLRQRGFSIIEKNFRGKNGEIDIIALDKNTICFVEVKTRQSLQFGLGVEAVAMRKQQKIIQTALWYLKKNGLSDRDFRFDVIAVFLNDCLEPAIEYLENAFEGF